MTYIQGFILQIIIYILLWYWDAYVAFLLCIVMPVILAAILFFSWIAEKIEPSKVPKSYFKWMFASIFPPLAVLLYFVIINAGNYYWLD